MNQNEIQNLISQMTLEEKVVYTAVAIIPITNILGGDQAAQNK